MQEEQQYKEAQEALRRQSMQRRRMSNIRRAALTARMRQWARAYEKDWKASAEEGRVDVKEYREVQYIRQLFYHRVDGRGVKRRVERTMSVS